MGKWIWSSTNSKPLTMDRCELSALGSDDFVRSGSRGLIVGLSVAGKKGYVPAF